MRKYLKICPYCLEEIRSRGEKVIIHDHIYGDEIPCDLCDEETEEVYIVKIK